MSSETEQTGSKKAAKKRRKKKDKAEPELEPTAPAMPSPEAEAFAIDKVAPPSNMELWTVGAEQGVDHLERIAKIFADSSLVPTRYEGKKADCAIVIAMALKHGADILGFMQNVYVVHGNPGMETKLAIALVNNSGVYEGSIDWDMKGKEETPERTATAWAIDAKSGRRHEMSVSLKQANQAGWTKPVKLKGGGTMASKWTSMPEVMLRYRSAMQLIRLYHPEILFGMATKDDLVDAGPKTIEVDVIPPHRDEIRDAVSSATASTPRLAPPPADETPLSESISKSATPVAGAQQGGLGPQRPASEGSLSSGPAPEADADGQTFLTPAVAPQETLPPDDEIPPADNTSKLNGRLAGLFKVLDAPEPTTDADMRAERVAVVTLYTELAKQHGEDVMKVTSVMTATLKDEIRRLIKEMDLIV